MNNFLLASAIVFGIGGAAVGGYSAWKLQHLPAAQQTVIVTSDNKLTQRTIPVVDQTPQDARQLIIVARAELKSLDTTMKQIKGKGWDVEVDCDTDNYCDQHLYPDVEHKLSVSRTTKL